MRFRLFPSPPESRENKRKRTSIDNQADGKILSQNRSSDIVLAKLRFKFISYKQLSAIKAAKNAILTRKRKDRNPGTPEKGDFNKIPWGNSAFSVIRKSGQLYADFYEFGAALPCRCLFPAVLLAMDAYSPLFSLLWNGAIYISITIPGIARA